MKVIGFAGWSGSGKTTLVEQVVGQIEAHGLVVSLIKHAHHEFEIDYPGKDSYRHREAGASEVFLVSSKRWVLMHELRDEDEPTLEHQMSLMAPCDLVLVEGFKYTAIPKIEVHRPENGKALLYPENPNIIAIATDGALTAPLPVLDLNDSAAIARFILDRVGLA